MTAWTELVDDGQLGDQGVLLLYRTVRTVALARNFPPPEGHGVWTLDAIMETAHEFLTSPNAPKRLTQLALTAFDDDSFARLLGTAVANYLRSQGRTTAVGRIVVRLKDILTNEFGFTVVPDGVPGAGNVTLREHAEGDGPDGNLVWNGDTSGLLSAAYSVADVNVVRWRSDSRREPPLADAPSLRAVSTAVLSAAGGSMRFSDLAVVVGRRFGLGPVAAVTATDELDSLATASAGADLSAVQAAAADLVAELTPRQVAVLAWLGEPVRVIADQTGLAKSTVGWVSTRLRESLMTRLRDEPDGEDVLIAARELARDQAGAS